MFRLTNSIGKQHEEVSDEKRTFLGAIALACLLVAVPAGVHAENVLKSRVLAYWAARQKADLGAAYDFYSPTFRAQHSRAQFLSGFRRLVRFPPEEVRVLEVTHSPDGAGANVRVSLRLKSELAGQQVDIEATSEEAWILEGGLWWKKDEPFVPNV